jgi:tRNA threonylcarbamoyladenosine biosynthesis protein TsaB
MKTLVLDASTSLLYIAFYNNNEEIFVLKGKGQNNHSENMLTGVKTGLEQCNLKMKDFGRIIVGIGPGSYTGLRVALTVAKMFAWTLNIPLYTVSSLDMLASGYYHKDGTYAIVTRAKKGHVYVKLVEVKSGKINIIFNDCFLKTEEFYQKIEAYDYFEINMENCLLEPLNLELKLVEDLHGITPNYLRGEL